VAAQGNSVSSDAWRATREPNSPPELASPGRRAAGADADAQLLRALGTWSLAAAIVNITIGGGIFRIPASPEVTGRLGPAAPLAYVVCAIAMGLIVLCLAEAGPGRGRHRGAKAVARGGGLIIFL
jgi:amino acid transporter